MQFVYLTNCSEAGRRGLLQSVCVIFAPSERLAPKAFAARRLNVSHRWSVRLRFQGTLFLCP